MIIQKHNMPPTGRRSKDMLVSVCCRNMNMSAVLRDAILPHTHIRVDIDGSKVTLIPTFDENDYKLCIEKSGRMGFAWFHAARFIQIPEKTKFIVKRNEDGNFSFDINQ